MNILNIFLDLILNETKCLKIIWLEFCKEDTGLMLPRCWKCLVDKGHKLEARSCDQRIYMWVRDCESWPASL